MAIEIPQISQRFTDFQISTLEEYNYKTLRIGGLTINYIGSKTDFFVVDSLPRQYNSNAVFNAPGLIMEVAIPKEEKFLWDSGSRPYLEQEDLLHEENKKLMPALKNFAHLEILEPWQLVQLALSYKIRTGQDYFKTQMENGEFEYWNAISKGYFLYSKEAFYMTVGEVGMITSRRDIKPHVVVISSQKFTDADQFTRVPIILTLYNPSEEN